jgi:sRNA-binding regulator protein Hfq
MKTLFLLLLFLLSGSSFAQKSKKAVVHLKNGSIVEGRVTPVDNDKVVVQSGRNFLIFNNSEIDTISSKWPSKNIDAISKDFFFKTSAGLLIGNSNNRKEAPLSFNASFNHRFYRQLYIGLGMGVDFLEESYMPVFMNFEYHFRNSRFTPFIGLQGGYMVPLDGDVNIQGGGYRPWMSYSYPYYETLENRGGFMVNPSLGFVSHINENLGWSLSFGYRVHQVTFEKDDNYSLETNYNRLSVHLGLIFN